MSTLGNFAIVATTYIASQGETLRQVCHNYYGRSDSDIITIVANKNPYILSKLTFDGGDIVVFPKAPTSTASTTREYALWDNLAYVETANKVPVKKNPTRVPTVKLLASLDAYRRSKITPVIDEEPPEPRPPLPSYSAAMDYEELDDPYSLFTDILVNLR